MPKCVWPATRLFCKTRPPTSSRARQPGKSARAICVQSGLAPKARRAFAIFVAERGTAKKGDPKEAHSVELKRLGKLWKQQTRRKPPIRREAQQSLRLSEQLLCGTEGCHGCRSLQRRLAALRKREIRKRWWLSGLTRLRSRMYPAEILSWAKGLMAKCFPQPACMDVDVP